LSAATVVCNSQVKNYTCNRKKPLNLRDDVILLEDPRGTGQQYAFDIFSEKQLEPFISKLDQKVVLKKRSTENDYDSDTELVRRAKTKMNRELRLAILNYKEKGGPRLDPLLKMKPNSV